MKRLIVISIILISLCGTLGAEEEKLSPISLNVASGVNLPIGRDAGVFLPGVKALVTAGFELPFLPVLALEARAGYDLARLHENAGTSLSLAHTGLGLSVNLPIGEKLLLGAFGSFSYFYGMLHGTSDFGVNPAVSGGIRGFFNLSSMFGLGLEISYSNYLGLYNDIDASLAFRYRLPVIERAGSEQFGPDGRPLLLGARSLELEEVDLLSIFPVFYKFYNESPVGSAVLYNPGGLPAENIHVNFFIKQYMDNPKQCPAPETLDAGQKAEVELYALFTNQILLESEGTTLSVSIILDYTIDGEDFKQEVVESIKVLSRNAITWDDDKKAAAFVTAKDSTVNKFSKNVIAMTNDATDANLDEAFLKGIAIHNSLGLYDLSYVIDPMTPYEEFSQDALAIDFLQFPQQTLAYKAGDCDDLSTLYCALLESLGVETAFITIPGHIYAAFALVSTKDKIEKNFTSLQDFIFEGDKVWVPVEVTEIDGGFLEAWRVGAQQWRRYEPEGKAGFFNVREAWRQYEPVGFIEERAEITLPSKEEIADSYAREVVSLIDRELFTQVEKLLADIKRSNNPVRSRNRLGVLYARFGLLDKAVEQFNLVLDEEDDYAPALINMGNIYFMKDDIDTALSFYDRAEEQAPNNARLVLAIARSHHELENYGSSRKAYDTLKSLDAKLAEQYSYLELRGDEAQRASESASLGGVVEWDE